MGAERSAPIIPPFVVGTAPPASGPLSASASSNCPGQVNRFQGGGALRLLRWVKAAWAWGSPVLRVVQEACEISSRCFLSSVPGSKRVCRRIGVLKQGCADLHVGRIEEISHVQRQWPPAARESNALPLHLANAVGKAPHTEPTQSSARVASPVRRCSALPHQNPSRRLIGREIFVMLFRRRLSARSSSTASDSRVMCVATTPEPSK